MTGASDINISSSIKTLTFSAGLIDFLSMEKVSANRIKPICRLCGKTGLRWGRENGVVALFEKKRPHKCPNAPLSLKDLNKLNEH